jgi:hypothetical protein
MAQLTIEDRYDIIPTVNGNDKDEAPMIFHCKVLNPNEREQCLKFEVEKMSEDGRAPVTVDRRQMFLLSVQSIENCNVNGKDITTARQFLQQSGMSAYYDDVTLKMIPHLSAEVVSKN